MSDRVVELKRGKRGLSFCPSPTTPLVHFVSSGSTPTGHQFLRRPRDVDGNKNASSSALLRAGDLWVLFSPEGVMKILTPTLSSGKTPALVSFFLRKVWFVDLSRYCAACLLSEIKPYEVLRIYCYLGRLINSSKEFPQYTAVNHINVTN